jgi:hypothetical protein
MIGNRIAYASQPGRAATLPFIQEMSHDAESALPSYSFESIRQKTTREPRSRLSKDMSGRAKLS